MSSEIIPISIDFAEIRNKSLTESWLRMFGGAVSTILGRMFGQNSIPVTIRGTQSEIESFANTLSNEKRYLTAYQQYGLNDPRTYRNKSELDVAVKSFENTTGIQWPFRE